MSTVLDRVRARGVELRLEGDRLQARCPVPADLRDLIREHRADLIALLTPIGAKPAAPATPAPLGPGLSPALQAQRWGPSIDHDLPPIQVEHPDPVAQAKALEWADRSDPYARAERRSLEDIGLIQIRPGVWELPAVSDIDFGPPPPRTRTP